MRHIAISLLLYHPDRMLDVSSAYIMYTYGMVADLECRPPIERDLIQVTAPPESEKHGVLRSECAFTRVLLAVLTAVRRGRVLIREENRSFPTPVASCTEEPKTNRFPVR